VCDVGQSLNSQAMRQCVAFVLVCVCVTDAKRKQRLCYVCVGVGV
jgi:hypothetical protein